MPSTEVKLSELVVVGIFKKFQVRYLHKWTSAIDEVEDIAVNEWAIELGGLNPEQIQRGLDSLPEGWPPTAGEFKNLCVEQPDRRLDASHRENRASHMIESDEVKEKRRVAAKKAVKEMKKVLKTK